MRPHGRTKLGFYPLPTREGGRLRAWMAFPPEFSALDPCVGDGVAFAHLLGDSQARRYGIEIDADQVRSLAIAAGRLATKNWRWSLRRRRPKRTARSRITRSCGY